MSPPTPHPAELRVEILPQPDDTTCGPTCLHAVYRAFGDDIPLRQIVAETPALPKGGTLAVLLGTHALRRGYRATLFTFNLDIFDPTWFAEQPAAHGSASSLAAQRARLAQKLKAQARHKRRHKLRLATAAYDEFLTLGGDIRFEDLTSRLLTGFIRRGLPVLVGLSSTYLYRCMREHGLRDDDDDLRGTPSGHFVVLHGLDPERRLVRIADPLANNPGFGTQTYEVPVARLIGAILLGVLTYDANLLVLEPPGRTDPDPVHPGPPASKEPPRP